MKADSWDGESFNVYVNGNSVFTKQYWVDSSYWSTSDGGTSLAVNNSNWSGVEEKHQINISTTLDSKGKVGWVFQVLLMKI